MILELLGLRCEIRLRRVQLFRSNAKPMPFEDGQQIPEVSEFSPVIHGALLNTGEFNALFRRLEATERLPAYENLGTQ